MYDQRWTPSHVIRFTFSRLGALRLTRSPKFDVSASNNRMHSYTLGSLLALFSISNVLTSYLYLYPTVKGCSFPAQPERQDDFKIYPSQYPPFRLLVLGDPQLEGDSSIVSLGNGFLPSLHTLWSDIREKKTVLQRTEVIGSIIRQLFISDLPLILQSYRKRLDLFGNDYYLAHIYRTLHWTLAPTHVAVLGDLIGSQWVSDEEFERRGRRYWERVFQKGRKMEDEVAKGVHIGSLADEEGLKAWSRRVINVAGNHDIGYAGDMTLEKVQRFERVFGRANWETRFSLPIDYIEEGLPPVELRLVVLNSLNLDAPVLDSDLQGETYKFLNDVIGASKPVEDRTTGTILLTHLPLHKETGICVDGPFFAYHEEQHGGGVREQNHLSYDASKGILEGLYGMHGDPNGPGHGMGRNGLILTGHDHEGCDVYHHLPQADDYSWRTWAAEKWEVGHANRTSSESHQIIPGIREITVRSMMGDFNGNAGLLTAWFDPTTREWQFDYSTCALGKQHLWWAVHIFDAVTIVFLNYVGWSIFRSTKNQNASPDGVKEKTL
ncbi:hypothetical protein ACLMJK_008677 [Lecanora helva]